MKMFLSRRKILIKIKKKVLKNSDQTINDTLLSPDFAYIEGPAGNLLASCSENNIKCTGILVPTIAGVADHIGTIKAIEALNKFILPISIDVSTLKKRTELIKEKVQETLQSIAKQYEKKRLQAFRNLLITFRYINSLI
jgi:predicted ATP-grasp superfamily ATP-dependent carboligase